MLRLLTPDGTPFDVPSAEVEILPDHAAVRLVLDLPAGALAEVEAAGLFHLLPEVRRRAPTIDAQAPVRLVVSLAEDLLLEVPEDPTEILAAGGALARTDSWFATRLEQQQGRALRRQTTIWHDLEPVRRGGVRHKSSGLLMDALIDLLAHDGDWWFEQEEPGAPVLRLVTTHAPESQLYWALVDESARIIVIYGVLRDPVPASRLQAVATAVGRLNSGMTLGNLELDTQTGRVRFKTSLALEGLADAHLADAELMRGLLRPILVGNALTLGRCARALATVRKPE